MLSDFSAVANAIRATTRKAEKERQESSRHKLGYALRIPRIFRIRDDKTVGQISTLDEVRRIYEEQLEREEGPGTKE